MQKPLPESHNDLADFTSKSFVIDKPVSGEAGGDQYWIYKKGSHTFLAVFDCMGSGHLARMASRIYINALKKVVVDIGIEYTGSILQYVHREIQSKFESKDDAQISTGADLAIIKINQDEKTLEFAGAKIDLFIVRDGKISVCKSDRMQVGDLFDFRHQYNSNTISLNAGESQVFYLATDGARDLIGGPDNRKVGVRDLKELFVKNYHHSMANQKLRISKYFEDWQGDNMQPDDILLIGFEV